MKVAFLKKRSGIINKPIARKENSIIERYISDDGQEAITDYEVIKEFNNISLIKCSLQTQSYSPNPCSYVRNWTSFIR